MPPGHFCCLVCLLPSFSEGSFTEADIHAARRSRIEKYSSGALCASDRPTWSGHVDRNLHLFFRSRFFCTLHECCCGSSGVAHRPPGMSYLSVPSALDAYFCSFPPVRMLMNRATQFPSDRGMSYLSVFIWVLSAC